MVDFKKKLKKKTIPTTLDPAEIYETLDRASDKGPLRPAQKYVLSTWHKKMRNERDLIIKLHTGQGKTLIGALMLYSRLIEKQGPSLYLCPNHFLVEQTCNQAEQFGIPVVTAGDHLPDEFLGGQAILVATARKLFNGLTKFGLGRQSISVGCVLLDDCHACIETIKESCSIILETDKDPQPYQEILELFSDDLKDQGVGTFADICNEDFDAFLTVPYWAWIDHHQDVTTILSNYKHLDAIKFAWPLIKDMVKHCFCIISGTKLEIIPYVSPIHMFGSFFDAPHRVFMSATVTDDSFLLGGLGLESKTIEEPLTYPKEKWCGEKMLILPSMLDAKLTRDQVVTHFAAKNQKRQYGVVGLAPSFRRSELWQDKGAAVADKDTITAYVDSLRSGDCERSLCIVNRYDGVDLPDHACRILVIDSKPQGMSLYDRLLETCRPGSDVIAQRIARIIEQGLGRSVRGEKDYCAIVLAGADLVQAIRSSSVRKYYSAQTQTQIDIGLEVAGFAKEDIDHGADPLVAMIGLVRKVLDRDEGWKQFYAERMRTVKARSPSKKMLSIFATERKAEKKALASRWPEAANIIQDMLDQAKLSEEDRGWYLQEMARYMWHHSKAESCRLQLAAHDLNRFLLKPKEGVTVKKLEAIPRKRVEAIATWVRSAEGYDDLIIRIGGMLTDLRFGGNADRFEAALHNLGQALGFSSERPDKEWGVGPDVLWCLRNNEYMLIECKNRVVKERKSIVKSETGQMNNSCAWFTETYGDCLAHNRLIIPTKKLGRGAGFNAEVAIIRSQELSSLTRSVRRFFMEFQGVDFSDLDVQTIQQWLKSHNLQTRDLISNYAVAPRT